MQTESMTNKKESIGKAIGRVASGVFVVTTKQNGKQDGFLASWVNQAAFNPPMVTVAFNKERPLLQEIKSGSQFTVNILSKQNMNAYKNFAKPQQANLDRFESLSLKETKSSGPIITDSVAYLECSVHSIVEAGDHVVIIAEVLDGNLLQGNAEPMVHIRSNGFQY